LRIGILIDLPVNVIGIASVNVHLPVIVDVGAAQAEVSAINCTGSTEQARDTTVAVRVKSGTVNAYIGDTPGLDPMAKSLPVMGASDIQQAKIASVQLLGGLVSADVKGKAVVQPVTGTGASEEAMTFGTGAEGATTPATPQTIGNSVQLGQTLSSVTASLLGSNGLDVEVKLLGTCLIACDLLKSTGLATVTGTVLPAVVGPVTNVLANTVDPLVTNLLAALGVQVGSATVLTTGARCGVPVLI